MGILWYFYIVSFEDYLNWFYFLVLTFPYILVYPTILNVKGLRDTVVYKMASEQAELDIAKDQPKKQTKDIDNQDLVVEMHLSQVYNHYMVLTFVIIFIYFAICKQYLVAYDYIIAIPFMWRFFHMFSQSQAAALLAFIMAFSYAGQFWMWLAWQRRMIANVNNYWTQCFINSIWWALVCYVINNHIADLGKKNIEKFKNEQKDQTS